MRLTPVTVEIETTKSAKSLLLERLDKSASRETLVVAGAIYSAAEGILPPQWAAVLAVGVVGVLQIEKAAGAVAHAIVVARAKDTQGKPSAGPTF